MARRVALAVCVVATSLVFAPPARACSCVLGDVHTALKGADAAFVGALVSRDEPSPGRSPSGDPLYSSGEIVTWHFRVDQVFKGPLGRSVDVLSAVSGASCGFEVKPGEPIGILLRREDGAWKGSLCGQVEPAKLRRAAKPLPAPDGEGPLAFLVGGRYGDYRTIGLDRQGRTLHYGAGAGNTGLISVCPGSRRAVEIVGMNSGPPFPSSFAVRDLSTFRVLREMRLTELHVRRDNRHLDVHAVSCRDPTGETALIFAARTVDESVVAKIVRIRDDRRSTVWQGEALSGTLNSASADVFIERANGEVLAVDADSGSEREIARLPRPGESLSLSSDGTRLLALSATWPQQYLSVVNVRDHAVETVRLHRQREAMWASDNRIVVLGGPHENSNVTNFDTGLTKLSSWPNWGGRSSVVLGDRLYGLTFYELRAASLDRGGTRTLRSFESPLLYHLVAVPPVSGSARGPGVAVLIALGAAALVAASLLLRRRFS
jgi:hypothetical protein